MEGDVDFALALFGGRPLPRVYDGLSFSERAALADEVLLLERKSRTAPPRAGELETMLSATMEELKAALGVFRGRRQEVSADAATGDEAARKLVQADAKASIDAISLIVRTLEKIDSLQRTLANDRAAQDEDPTDEAGYRALVDQIEALIDQRATERARGEGAGGSGRDGAGLAGGGSLQEQRTDSG